jgi:hypothetical protein
VTVAELQVLFSNLGNFLRSSGAAGVGGELEFLGSKLTPFRDYKLKAFAEFLEKAEAYSRGALAPKTRSSSAKKPKVDPLEIERSCQRVLELYNKAIDPHVTVDQIEAAFTSLEQYDPTKARLDVLATSVGFSQKFKSKADCIKAIRQKILGRKGAFERPNA